MQGSSHAKIAKIAKKSTLIVTVRNGWEPRTRLIQPSFATFAALRENYLSDRYCVMQWLFPGEHEDFRRVKRWCSCDAAGYWA